MRTGLKTAETKSGILCEIYGMSDRLATSPGGEGGHGRGETQLDTRRSVINDQVATSRIYVASCQMQFLNISHQSPHQTSLDREAVRDDYQY